MTIGYGLGAEVEDARPAADVRPLWPPFRARFAGGREVGKDSLVDWVILRHPQSFERRPHRLGLGRGELERVPLALAVECQDELVVVTEANGETHALLVVGGEGELQEQARVPGAAAESRGDRG